MIARVQKLAQLPPRISRKLAVLARRLPWTRTLDVHVAIALAILRAPTPAVLPMLAVDEMIERRRKEDPYAEARTAISALAPRAADPALLAEARAIAGEGSDLAALWAAHDADPDDEQRRAVLGDALQLANDPRGDLIQLQLAISRVRVYAPRARPAPDDPIAEATSSARAIPGITIEPGETFDLAAPA